MNNSMKELPVCEAELTENNVFPKIRQVTLELVTWTPTSLDLVLAGNITSMCNSSTVCHHLPHSVLHGTMPLFSSKKLVAIFTRIGTTPRTVVIIIIIIVTTLILKNIT